MKLIKLLITLTLLNVVFVGGLSKYLSANPPESKPTKVEIIATGSEKLAPVVTPKPSIKKAPQTKVAEVPKQAVAKTPTTAKPVAAPTRTTAPSVAPKPSGCVIKIDGVSYEITALRKSHSGGDIFTCNSDMSAIFWGRHNQKILQKMQAYRI